jgi:thioredoxin-related protein
MNWLKQPLINLTLLVALLCVSVSAHAAELLVVEQDHCPFCERFNQEIAVAYPKTPEGQRAPLVRVQLNEVWPDPYTFIEPASVTPTFILVSEGKEVDRLVGYPGDEHFWFLLNEMLDKLP